MITASESSARLIASTTTCGVSTSINDRSPAPRITRSGLLRSSAAAITPASRKSPGWGICAWVGMSRRAQQRQSHDRALDVVAVLAVVEQRDAVAGLAQVGPAMGANFKARLVPACVGMRASLDVTELDLIRCPRRPHCDGKRDLEKLVLLLPVDFSFESKHPRIGVEDHSLFQRR